MAVLSNTTHEPPSTTGAGSVLAVADDARFVPLMVIKAPGAYLDVPSVELTIPPVVAICGWGAVPVETGTTLRPETVNAYTVPVEETTIWRAVIAVRVVPNSDSTGFSGIRAAVAVCPVNVLTD